MATAIKMDVPVLLQLGGPGFALQGNGMDALVVTIAMEAVLAETITAMQN